MREIKVRAPKGEGFKIAAVALDCGVRDASVHATYTYGLNRETEEVKVKTSTPLARHFVDTLVAAPFFDRQSFEISSHDIKSIVSAEPEKMLTRPTLWPPADVYADLWQQIHITGSYAVRSVVGGGLLGYGMIKNNLLLMVGAVIFTSFSTIVMAMGYGLQAQKWSLTGRGAQALAVGSALTVFGASAAALLSRSALLYQEFGSLSCNVTIAAVTGVLAAFADADDVGRRQLIGLAASYPFIKYPTWLGVCLVNGFPDRATTIDRLLTWSLCVIAMMVATALVYRRTARLQSV